jgi:predicted DNA-binding protein (MmcQ/YjbR family)
MFAVTGLESAVQSISFKCTPEKFAELVEIEGIIPAHYVARYHWVTVENLDALRSDELKDLINNSYKLVWEKLPKGLRNQLSS